MNYLFLRNILETLLANFQCPKCQTKPLEQSLFLQKVSTGSVHVEVHCPSCHEKTTIHAELNQLTGEFLSSQEGRVFFEKFMNGKNAHIFKKTTTQKHNPDSLSEKDIQSVTESLQNHSTIQELIDDE